ncbi:response regulator [Pararhodobacter zhoushanensis]|uniref:response regulator n=1 Tax=Pararhodobacter zhoushanensis TaxID=2479545 RepID=UPI000F8EC4B6|nr:response regulator [Pararhodobacter zhoushanensis]
MSDTPAHLLIVDDDERIRELLKRYLVKQGFMVTAARDAAQARRLLSGLAFDLIVLDVMMPGEDGVALTQWLRGAMATPVILLTARGEAKDRITGFEAGADDYIAKPFEPRELVLRINAILRRAPRPEAGADAPQMLMLGRLRYEIETGELRDGQEPVRLTQTESALMRILAARHGQVVSREALVDQLGRDRGLGGEIAQERAVDVQITRLRRKIELDPRRPRYLQTVRGEGYMLTAG